MASPNKAIEKALYTALKDDSTLANLVGGTANPRIFNSALPTSNPTFPSVIFHLQGGGNTQESPREDHVTTYAIKAVSTTVSEGHDIDNAVADVLKSGDISVADDYADYGIFQTSVINFTEHIGGGSIFYHVGHFYRIMVEGTA